MGTKSADMDVVPSLRRSFILSAHGEIIPNSIPIPLHGGVNIITYVDMGKVLYCRNRDANSVCSGNKIVGSSESQHSRHFQKTFPEMYFYMDQGKKFKSGVMECCVKGSNMCNNHPRNTQAKHPTYLDGPIFDIDEEVSKGSSVVTLTRILNRIHQYVDGFNFDLHILACMELGRDDYNYPDPQNTNDVMNAFNLNRGHYVHKSQPEGTQPINDLAFFDHITRHPNELTNYRFEPNLTIYSGGHRKKKKSPRKSKTRKSKTRKSRRQKKKKKTRRR